MESRTCSHRISELYNEIILTDRFKEEFISYEAFYYNSLYVTIYRNKSFKSKLIIVDKDSQNIVFENILCNGYIVFNDLKSDKHLFSFDLNTSSIFKFNNPVLSFGEINDSIQVQHNFIIYSKKITELIIKDDIIYLVGEMSNQCSIDFISNNKIDRIDFSKFKNDYIETIFLLVGISVENLEILNGHFFTGGNSFKIWNRNLKQKNCILVEYFNDEYQECESYLINYIKEMVKPIHPSFLTKVSDNYLVSTPYTESTHYGRYENFELIRLSDYNSFNLYDVLSNSYRERMESGSIIIDEVNFLDNDILVIGDYQFSCSNLFKNKNAIPIKDAKLKISDSLLKIKCNFFDGYAIELHTIKSTLNDNGSFDTLRSALGEHMYKLKYNFDKSSIEPIAQRCSTVLKEYFSDIDIIIPSPPSNLNRPFQPVYELASRISELTKIPVDLGFVKKLPTEQIKSLSDQESRNIVLERAISIKDKKYKGKNILLFDDLFRSGDTLNVIAKKLKYDGEVNNIKALCVTKTRTKR